MPDTPDPHHELAEISRRLRVAVEIQHVLREGRDQPAPQALASARAGGSPVSAPAGSAPSAAPPRETPAPAARVTETLPPPGVPGPAAPVLLPWQREPGEYESLGELHDAFAACERCELGKVRKNFVFGVGNPNAGVMFVGEAPGRDEDLQGEPFVGAAGQLLNKIIGAIGFTREEVYIANILKCRPPGNRDPRPEEIASCEPILRRQIEQIQPLIICTLGAFAARTLLGVTSGISRLRGKLHEYHGTPLIPTYHPAALLRNPAWKRPTWEDVQRLRQEYDRLRGETSSDGEKA